MKPILSILSALAPFVFGLIRAVTTGKDYRMLLMAIAGGAGAAGVAFLIKTGRASMIVFLVATVLAAAVAYLMGATAAAGIWPVAGVFGFCFAVSNALRGSPALER